MIRTAVSRRRWLGVVGAGATGVVAACAAPGRDDAAPRPAPATQGVVIRFGSKDTAPASLARMEQLAAEDFAADYPGARVEIEPLTGGYFEKLQAHLAAGTEPDTARIDEYYIAFLAGRDALQPMDPYASRDKRFDPRGLYPIPYKAGQYRGKFYGLTTSPNAYVLLFNRTAFEEAGLKPPPADHRDTTWTWARAREDARRLTRPGATPQETRFGFLWDVSLLSRLSSQVRANGGRLFDRDEDPRRGAFDDPKTLDLLQLYQDMRHRDRSIPADADLKAAPAPSVANGRLAMQVSLANVGGAAFDGLPFTWDIAPLAPRQRHRAGGHDADHQRVQPAAVQPESGGGLGLGARPRRREARPVPGAAEQLRARLEGPGRRVPQGPAPGAPAGRAGHGRVRAALRLVAPVRRGPGPRRAGARAGVGRLRPGQAGGRSAAAAAHRPAADGLMGAAGAAAGRPPSLLVVTIEHLPARALGCYGNPYGATPNIDRLAADGHRFRHCTVASPLCVPSRTSMFSGRYPSLTGCRDNTGLLPAHEAHLPGRLAGRRLRLRPVRQEPLLPQSGGGGVRRGAR